MKRMLLLCIVLAPIAGLTQQDSSMVKFENPSSVWQSKGFSQAVIIDNGNSEMVLISGQVPLDSNGNLIGKDDFNKQTEQVFINIKNIVSNAGGAMNNIVKLSVYVKDISQVQKFREVRDRFINTQHPPASTLVEVSRLFRDDVLLEVDATAIIPKK